MFYKLLVVPIFYKILYMTVVGSIVGLIICLIRNIFDKRLSGKWRCIMWFVVLATLLIPIRFEIKTSYNIPNNIINNIEDIKDIPQKQVVYHRLEQEQFENQEPIIEKSIEEKKQTVDISKSTTADNIEVNEIVSNSAKPQTNIKLQINYILTNILFPSTWLIGTIIFVIMFISGVIKIRNKSKKRNLQDERINSILENCKKQLNINKNVKVVLQENSKTSIFGFFSPVILLSESILKESDDTIKYIFLHELSHYKRKDTIFNYILLAILSIHWFNPIVWFIFMKVREDIELGADELAIEKLNKKEKKEYGLVLINLLQNASHINYTANMLCISDTGKNMERRILMIKRKNRNKFLSAIVVIAIIGIIAGIVFFKSERVDMDVNAGLVNNLKEENYEKVWKEPLKFNSYQEYRDYSDSLYKDKYKDVNGKITEEEKNKLISEEVAKEKIESMLSNLGRNERITHLELHKQYISLADYNYTANLGKNIYIDIDAENGKFLDFYDDAIAVKQLKKDKLTFDEAKNKAIELYSNMNFLNSKYEFYSAREMTYSYGVGVLDKSGIQYECTRWEATFYEISDSNVLNQYRQVVINFFISEGKTYITLVKEIDKKKLDVTLERGDIQNNPVVISKEKAIEIAKEMDKKISDKGIETTRTVLVNNEVNEYVWLQEQSKGEDIGLVSEKELHDNTEKELKENSTFVPTAQTHYYNKYYYPEKIVRNTYEVKIDYSGEIILDESKPYMGDDYNGNIGRIYYVDCTTGEIIGGRNYGTLDTTIEGEFMENGEAKMATKNIFFDITTGEKVAERNFNYSQEIIDEFMKK